jgi:hypothetical protein
MVGTTTLVKQTTLLDRWLATLQQIPAVDIIWLEGSLAADRANPGSDIDIRFGIADAAYQQLWETDRTPLLVGLGEHLLLENTFVRALMADGVIVEAWAYKTSELNALELYEWKILFSRLPDGEPTFRKLPARSPAETWPDTEPLTSALVWYRTTFALLIMAEVPALFYCQEWHSVQYTLDMVRLDLLQVLYLRLGMRYGKRAKHFSELFPQAWLDDLEQTYVRAGENPLDVNVLVKTLVDEFAVLGKHLQALSDQAGGGFEADWYWRLYDQMTTELSQFQTSA